MLHEVGGALAFTHALPFHTFNGLSAGAGGVASYALPGIVTHPVIGARGVLIRWPPE